MHIDPGANLAFLSTSLDPIFPFTGCDKGKEAKNDLLEDWGLGGRIQWRQL